MAQPSTINAPIRRAVVVGTSGCGKTTFAARAAPLLDLPHCDLDELFWGPNWKKRPDYPSLIADVVDTPRWLISGNYSSSREIVWPKADTVFWLDYSFRVVFTRALLRTIRRVATRERLFAGNVETFRNSFLHHEGIPWWVIKTYRRRRLQYGGLREDPAFGHLRWEVFRKPAEAERFLGGVHRRQYSEDRSKK